MLGPAIEVMKIIKPHADALRNETDALLMLRVLIKNIQETNPANSLRLASLMFGVSIDYLMDEFGEADQAGSKLVNALVKGFSVNSLPDLVNAGALIGLLDEGWSQDAERTN